MRSLSSSVDPLEDQPRFIVDMNVGRLSVWLRALGYDALFINPIDDGELVKIAASQGRIILTKDNGILARNAVRNGPVRALLIEHKDVDQQLRQVVEAFGLIRSHAFNRCLVCNELLHKVPTEEAKEHVPPKVRQMHEHYWRCLHCGRYYWMGSHWRRMRRVIDEMF